MKTLKQLNNVEKARVLHTWFPEEIPALLDTIAGMSRAILEDEAEHRAEWQDGLFGFDFWLQLARQAERIIIQYGKGCTKGTGSFQTSFLTTIRRCIPSTA